MSAQPQSRFQIFVGGQPVAVMLGVETEGEAIASYLADRRAHYRRLHGKGPEATRAVKVLQQAGMRAEEITEMPSLAPAAAVAPEPSARALVEEFTIFLEAMAPPGYLVPLRRLLDANRGMIERTFTGMIERRATKVAVRPTTAHSQELEEAPAALTVPKLPEIGRRVTPPDVLRRIAAEAPRVAFREGALRFVAPDAVDEISAVSTLDAACRKSLFDRGLWAHVTALAEILRTVDPERPEADRDWSLPQTRALPTPADLLKVCLREASADVLWTVLPDEADGNPDPASTPFEPDDPAVAAIRWALAWFSAVQSGETALMDKAGELEAVYAPGAVIPPHSLVDLVQTLRGNAVFTWLRNTLYAHVRQDTACVLAELRDAGQTVPALDVALGALDGLLPPAPPAFMPLFAQRSTDETDGTPQPTTPAYAGVGRVPVLDALPSRLRGWRSGPAERGGPEYAVAVFRGDVVLEYALTPFSDHGRPVYHTTVRQIDPRGSIPGMTYWLDAAGGLHDRPGGTEHAVAAASGADWARVHYQRGDTPPLLGADSPSEPGFDAPVAPDEPEELSERPPAPSAMPRRDFDPDESPPNPPLGDSLTDKAFEKAGGYRDVHVVMTEARDGFRWPEKFRSQYDVRLHGNDSYMRARDKSGPWRRIAADSMAHMAVSWAWAEVTPPMPVPRSIAYRTLPQHIGAVLREYVSSGWVPMAWQGTVQVAVAARDAWRRARAALAEREGATRETA